MGRMIILASAMVAMLFLIGAIHAQYDSEVAMECMSGIYLYCYDPTAVPYQFNYTDCIDTAKLNYAYAVNSLYLGYCAVATGKYEQDCQTIKDFCLGGSGGYEYELCQSGLATMGAEMAKSGESPCNEGCGCNCDNQVTERLRQACIAFDLPMCESMCKDTYDKCVSDNERYYDALFNDYEWCDSHKRAPTPDCMTAGCPAGYTCENGECFPKCATGADCPGGKICAPDGSKCVDRWTCTETADCIVPGYTCIGGLCYDENNCARPSDCPDGKICSNGKCGVNATGAGCGELGSCPTGETCSDGKCVKELPNECGANTPCPIGMVCSDFHCEKRTIQTGHWTEETDNGTVTIQVTGDGVITINGRIVQAITGADANIVITINGVTINGRPLTAEDGVLVVDISDLPHDGDKISTTFGDYVVVFVNGTTALVFNRCFFNPACGVYSSCQTDGVSCAAEDCCDERCVNTTIDPTNCGACGHRCQIQWVCMDKTCQNPQEVMKNITGGPSEKENVPVPEENAKPGILSGFSDIISGFIRWLSGLFGMKG